MYCTTSTVHTNQDKLYGVGDVGRVPTPCCTPPPPPRRGAALPCAMRRPGCINRGGATTAAPAEDCRHRALLAARVPRTALPEIAPALHRQIHAKGKALHEKKLGAVGSGNNMYTAIPELRHVMSGPSVRGVLRSVLGTDTFMHAHRFMHVTGMGSDQSFHKDGQSGHGPIRHHRPRWCMVLYCTRFHPLSLGLAISILAH